MITKTPFRVSFLGGGTDFISFFYKYGGHCLSTSINQYAYVYLRHISGLLDSRNQVVYSKIEKADRVDEISHPIVRECLKFKNVDSVSIGYDADIPARTGLGTSSAFSVGLISALNAYKGYDFDKFRITKEAIYVERELCKESGGIQDQIASAYGGLNHLVFEKSGFDVIPIKIKEQRLKNFENNLILLFTGMSRNSSDIQKSVNRSDKFIEDKLLELNTLTLKGVSCLEDPDADLDEFGYILNEAWEIKRSMSDKISNSIIDEAYDRALKNGALGGKILGAGGGGFLLLYVQPFYKNSVLAALQEFKEIPFKFDEKGTQILLNEREFV